MSRRHVDWEIRIPLAEVQPNHLGQREDCFKIVNDLYTAQYCEALGIAPTDRYRKIVARRAPLDQCEIEANWGPPGQSVVPGSLRIQQAAIGKPPQPARSPLPSAADAASGLLCGTGARRPQAGDGVECLLRAAPPEVEDAAAVAKRLAEARAGAASASTLAGSGANAAQQGDASRPPCDAAAAVAKVHMQLYDLEASKHADIVLTEELENMRKLARGDDIKQSSDPALRYWGEEGLRELEQLKRKFILPYAAERGSSMVPWQSPDYRNHAHIEAPSDASADLAEPIQATLEQIQEDLTEYAESHLPLELLTSRRDPWLFSALRQRLASVEITRMTGLLAHLLYWTVFGHLRPLERRLPQASQQSLVLTFQELWARLCEPGRQAGGELLAREAVFALPVYVLALKRGVESVFHRQYAKAFMDVHTGAGLALKLVDRLNVLVMNLLDPDCAFANFGSLDTSSEAARLWRKLDIMQMKLGLTTATKMLNREFRTTPMMLFLMKADGGEPSDARTRKFLQKSASDVVLSTVAATPLRANGPGLASPPSLDERRRRALYRTACRSMASAGSEIVAPRK